jgi:putative ABC transport system permease protein
MISLAGRDIRHAWARFVLTGLGLGLLIGVTLTMAGVYRGMVDDGRVLLDNSGADLWVVQRDTQGPYAEPSSVRDDLYRSVQALPGVADAASVTYLTMQVQADGREFRAMVVGIDASRPGAPGWPPRLVAGRHIAQAHDEAVVDAAAGLLPGQVLHLRGEPYTVVGQSRRTVSSGGDPMVFIPLRDAQQAQFQRDDDAVDQDRRRLDASTRDAPAAVREALAGAQLAHPFVNAVLVRVQPGVAPDAVAADVRRWLRHEAHTREAMEEILIGKLIATSARQIALFLVILAVVSAAIVAFIIYTMTLGKLREIAVLKLIGTRDRTIGWMILQQSLLLGAVGFASGRIVAGAWAPAFPKFVLLVPEDSALGLVLVLVICALASLVSIHAALRVDPADAIGG